MFENNKAFCSFSVDDIPKAKKFYGELLGLKVDEESLGGSQLLTIHLTGGGEIMIYPKKDHIPATFTIMNFSVADIEKAVQALLGKGIVFEHYEDSDEKGITHNEGPLIAWFKDPAGNFLSIIEDKTVENKIEINKFIPVERDKVFAAWTRPEFLEKWFYPEGMNLMVETLEPKIQGHFIFRYTGENGVFFTTGMLKEYNANEKLLLSCEVKGPDGQVIINGLLSVQFEDKYGGTEIHLVQEGFNDWRILKNFENGWLGPLENLFKLLVKGLVDKSQGLDKSKGINLYH